MHLFLIGAESRDSFISAICRCTTLRSLHLLASPGETHTAVFHSSDAVRVFSSLPRMEEIALDRDMFGREVAPGQSPVEVEIRHETVQRISFHSSLDPKVVLKVVYAPLLRSFEANSHSDSMAFVEHLAASVNSSTLQNLRVKFNPHKLLNGATSESNETLSRALTRCQSVRRMHIRGGPPSAIMELCCLQNMHTMTLTDCTIHMDPDRSLSNVPSLRDVSFHRCRALNNISCLKSPVLTRLSISGCSDLRGSLAFLGKHLPCLETLSISHQGHLGDVVVRDFPELRWLSLVHLHAKSLSVDTNQNLRDLTVEAAAITKTKIIAPRLQRMYFDCARYFGSLDSDNAEEVQIKIDAPALVRVSLDAEDVDLEMILHALDRSKTLERIDLNSVLVEELSMLEGPIRDRFPCLRFVGCNDGDVVLQPGKTPRIDS